MKTITQRQARAFLLRRQGLAGAWRFRGKAGALAFVRQAGGVQFDPVDVCGRNADLVLLSRVQGYHKGMLDELLYKDRALIDYFDKCLNIVPVETWPNWARRREASRVANARHAQINEVIPDIMAYLSTHECACARDLDMGRSLEWVWSVNTSLARAALETLYFQGDLVVHHKSGTLKYYAPAQRHIPHALLHAPEPHPEDEAHDAWILERRIGAIGMLWNRASDAWLDAGVRKADARNTAFERLTAKGLLLPVKVEGIRDALYIKAEDEQALDTAAPVGPGRASALGPLDSLLWDRKLIQALFEFDYKWEIYTPAEQRKYGYYVLPILYGDRLVARAEVIRDSKAKRLIVRNFWREPGVGRGAAARQAYERMFERLAEFNECTDIAYEVTL